jgi:hypothetical protein
VKKNLLHKFIILFAIFISGNCIAQHDPASYFTPLTDKKIDTIVNTNILSDTSKTTIIEELIYEYDTIYIEGDTLRFTDTLTYYVDVPSIYLSSAEIYFAPLFTRSVFTSPSSENYSYQELVQDSHKPFAGFSLGTNLNLKRGNWILQTGISYTQFIERFKYETSRMEIDTNSYSEFIIIDSYFELDSNNDTIWHYLIKEEWHTDIDTTIHITEHKNFNSYSYVEFPLILAYEFAGKRFSYLWRGGIIFGRFINARRKTVSPINYNETMSVNSDFPYLKRNYNLFFSIGINYKFSKNIDFLIQPYYRQSLNSLFNDDFVINQKFYSFGVNFGFRYYF